MFRWAQADQELDEELRDHIERKTEEYVAKGLAAKEADEIKQLFLSYRIRAALDGTRAFSWKGAEELSSANSGTPDDVGYCRGKAVAVNRWRYGK